MWELIRVNKRNSVLLLMAMGMLLVALGYVIGVAFVGHPQAGFFGIALAVVIWVVMLLTSYYGGSSMMLASSKAQKVTHDVHPQLFNVVDEMRIAANLPKMPDVYIINDPGMNAFATGRDPEHAAVAVTAGLLGRLNRDELQGVMAHEISHIVHRDILFVTLAGVALGAIVLVSQVFLRGMIFGGGRRSRYSSRSEGGGQAQAVMLVIALVCAILAPIFAQLLYFALSRKREYLADAGAARLTRYPEGLASALSKLAGGAQVASANKVTAPMYIINPLQKKMDLSAWTSTHPPIEERVRILRNLTHGASFHDYAKSYEDVAHKSKLIPASALKEDQATELRAGSAKKSGEAKSRQQMRQVGDLMHQLNGLLILTCACGLKLKLPPKYKSHSVKCPRCSKVLPVPKRPDSDKS